MAMMKKHKLELYANLLVKQNLFADEHPPTKKPCPQHIFRIHTSLCILCLLPASVTIPAWLKSSALTAQHKHTVQNLNVQGLQI